MRQIYIVRHGETEWSRNGRHTGFTDIPLTEKGKEQAAQLGECLRDVSFDHLFSSPLKRAHETSILCGFKPLIIDELLEWDYGDYEGVKSEEIHKKDPTWNIFTHGAPNGESVAAVKARVDLLIEKLETLEGNIALFSSGHIMRALTAQWLELPMEAGCRLVLSTASLSILGYEHKKRALKLWNDRRGALQWQTDAK
ncbi:MAG: Phosphoserine phosphatase 1 [Chlamydiae bacterium]|nr:Phosphoserine phosphatase 1 [Chlamydiota bacterium]